jgi:hypothetical protein
MVQGCYPADQIALDSDSATLSLENNTFNQIQNNNGWRGDHTPIWYPAGARMGYSASAVLSNLDAHINNNTNSGSLLLATNPGGTENFTTVPATVAEMVLQSCLGPIHLFPNCPSGTAATYGNFMARGGFLVSSSRNASNTVQYVRLISEQGQSAQIVNPWSGQTVAVYRNGVSAGTVSGTTFTLTTSVGEVIHLAPNGTSYAQILSLMGPCFSTTVNPSTAGTYAVNFLVAAPNAVTGACHISNSSGTNLSGSINVPATGGWQNFTTVTANVTLPAGQQTLSLNEDNAGWTINDVGFSGITSGGGGGTMTEQCSTLAESNTAGLTYSPITGGPNGEIACRLYSNAVGQFLQFVVTGIVQGTSYDVTIGYRSDPGRGQCQLSVNGTAQPQLATLDEYQATAAWDQTADLGTWTAGAAGTTRTFTFTVSGKNSASTGYVMAPEWIALTPL